MRAAGGRIPCRRFFCFAGRCSYRASALPWSKLRRSPSATQGRLFLNRFQMISRILSAFESFAFKFLDFDGRATRLEYWCVIPLVWLFICLLLPGDATEVWRHLLRREVPPLSPFHYGSLGLFLFTFVPRLSLTVRRLHDAGRSGKWAKLPFTAVSLGLVLSVGVLTAIPMSDPSGLGPGLMIAGSLTASLSRQLLGGAVQSGSLRRCTGLGCHSGHADGRCGSGRSGGSSRRDRSHCGA